MSIGNYSVSIEFKGPYIHHGYIEDGQKHIAIDFPIMTFPQKMFRSSMKKTVWALSWEWCVLSF